MVSLTFQEIREKNKTDMMHIYNVRNIFIFVLFVSSLFLSGQMVFAAPYVATTTVSLTVCGDALVAPSEFCDDGSNTGAYATSTSLRNCNPVCDAWGPYCGDGVVQVYYGEECDDGNNTSGDLCDALCQNESDPVTEGGGSGGGSGGGGGRSGGSSGDPDASKKGGIDFKGDTDLNIEGRAYPGATITVLKDGEVERVVEADSSANFDFTLTDQVPGIITLGFWAQDKKGRRSVTYAATFQVIKNAVTTLSGILIPPTLEVVPEKVSPGATASFEGSALPNSNLYAYVDDLDIPEETVAATNGDWSIAYDTAGLSPEAFHTVKADYVDSSNAELKSGFSLITNFYVGDRDVDTGLTADLNFDGFVNLTDFSILLFHWNTNNSLADINKDGNVSLPDFSIMLFYWTG
jgi:cysteine-rich repeat protein